MYAFNDNMISFRKMVEIFEESMLWAFEEVISLFIAYIRLKFKNGAVMEQSRNYQKPSFDLHQKWGLTWGH